MEWLPANAFTILAGGGLIGFLLGLLGGGGSLLAVPFLLQFGGLASPHLAIGTSALAVACNALVNSYDHALRGNVVWRPAFIFSLFGLGVAMFGAWVGLGTPGHWLILAFGFLTVLVGVWTILKKPSDSRDQPQCVQGMCPRVALVGAGVGAMAGFFGIGGGFMAVPALLWATGLSMPQVIGTALIGVAALGFGTAMTYAWAGQVVWSMAGFLLIGGVVGGRLGSAVGRKIHTQHKKMLQYLFGGFVVVVGLFTIFKNI